MVPAITAVSKPNSRPPKAATIVLFAKYEFTVMRAPDVASLDVQRFDFGDAPLRDRAGAAGDQGSDAVGKVSNFRSGPTGAESVDKRRGECVPGADRIGDGDVISRRLRHIVGRSIGHTLLTHE